MTGVAEVAKIAAKVHSATGLLAKRFAGCTFAAGAERGTRELKVIRPLLPYAMWSNRK